MKVMLQRDWYAPGDLPQMYLRRDNPSEVSDDLFPYLPSGAQIMGDDGKWLTKRETRKRVLVKRRDEGLDKSRAKLASNRDSVFTDDELLAEIDGKSPAPPNMPTTTTVVPNGSTPQEPSGKTLPVQAQPGDKHTAAGEKIVTTTNPIPSGGEQSKVQPLPNDDDTSDEKGLPTPPGKVTTK